MTGFTNEGAQRVGHATRYVERLRRQATEEGRDIRAPRFTPHDHVHFELKDTLSLGGTAEAYIRLYDDQGALVTHTDLDVITVSSAALSKYYGDPGDRGRATKSFGAAIYDVDDIQCP